MGNHPSLIIGEIPTLTPKSPKENQRRTRRVKQQEKSPNMAKKGSIYIKQRFGVHSDVGSEMCETERVTNTPKWDPHREREEMSESKRASDKGEHLTRPNEIEKKRPPMGDKTRTRVRKGGIEK